MKKIIFFLPFLLFASINQKIINYYKKTYPQIIIKKIIITPKPPKKYKKFKILFTPNSTYGNIKIDNRYYFVRIKAFMPVYVAKTIIRTNEPIFNHIRKKIVPFRYFYAKPLLKINKKLVASKIISKNAIITSANTKIAPDVFRGDIVTVIISSKDMSIYTKAKALEDGNIGDIIKIKLKNKIQKAQIIKKDVVTIKADL